jgi:cell division initiation protein
MNVSPLDLRQQRFKSALRGFDKVEVTAFLSAVADDYEQALRETDKLRQDVVRMEAIIAEHREHERTLKVTLLTAQRLADEIKSQAELESQRLEREATGRAALMIDKAQARLEDIQREIDGLRLKRKDVESSIEATIHTLRHTLDFVREQDARESGDRSLLHGMVA